MVQGGASPDDPALADYWAERRRKVKPPFDKYTLRLLARQDARCPLCGDHILTVEQPPQSPSSGNGGGKSHPSGDSRQLSRPPREIRPTAQ